VLARDSRRSRGIPSACHGSLHSGLPAPYNSALVERDRLAETVGPRGVASPAVFIAHQLAQYAERDRHLLFYSVRLSVRRSVRLSVYNASIVPKE